MTQVRALLDEGVATGVAPLMRLEVLHQGQSVLSAGNAPEDTVFDLASVTKVMSTTACCLSLAQSNALRLDDTVGTLLGDAPVASATVEDLLFHRSGLPAFRPFFAEAIATWPRLVDADCPSETRASARAHVIAAALAAPRAARREAVYSDLGFILLGEIVSKAGGLPLDALFAQRVAEPLGLTAGYRRLTAPPPLPAHLAPTGATRPREPAPGQEGMWSTPVVPTRPGEVDDDNAWAMDGVSGHAGLFGTARDVARYGQAVLEGRFAPPLVAWGADISTPGSTRALGFDTPSADGSSVGARFGRAGPKGAIGHLGFTGTSLWIDLDRQLVVALCTNRVALGRANIRIREFRPRVHDAILEGLHL
jgi:CubicO group peptidase (beta-lactamase class C family)